MTHLILAAAIFVQVPSFPEAKVYPHDCEISTFYDKFRDVSLLKVKLGTVVNKPGVHLDMDIYYGYNGKTREKMEMSKTVSFSFKAICKTWEWLEHKDLYMLVDDVRLDLGETDHDGDVKTGYVTERVLVTVPARDFLSMANAVSVRGKLGFKEFDLTENQLEALKDFAARLGVDSTAADLLGQKKKESDEKKSEERRKEKDRERKELLLQNKPIIEDLIKLRERAQKASFRVSKKQPILREKTYHKVFSAGLDQILKKHAVSSRHVLKMLEETFPELKTSEDEE